MFFLFRKKLVWIALALFPGVCLALDQQLTPSLEETVVKRPIIVFLVTEDSNNYEAHKTIPAFAQNLQMNHGYDTRVFVGKGPHGACEFEGMEVLDHADLLVVFCRRIALPYQQMNKIKMYLKKGKPLIGIRTANHAFTVMEEIQNGYVDWPEFVPLVLGCLNRGYGPVQPGTRVSVNRHQKDHPLLQDIPLLGWHSNGNVYKVKPLLDRHAKVYLTGEVNGESEPIAWTRRFGKSKVFYTSLGHPSDFKSRQFNTLLVQAIQWALETGNQDKNKAADLANVSGADK